MYNPTLLILWAVSGPLLVYAGVLLARKRKPLILRTLGLVTIFFAGAVGAFAIFWLAVGIFNIDV